MKEPIQVKLGLSLFPTLQHSSTPKELAPVPAKPLNSNMTLKTRFSMFNKSDLSASRDPRTPGLGLVKPTARREGRLYPRSQSRQGVNS
jgi:hypothetical protein